MFLSKLIWKRLVSTQKLFLRDSLLWHWQTSRKISLPTESRKNDRSLAVCVGPPTLSLHHRRFVRAAKRDLTGNNRFFLLLPSCQVHHWCRKNERTLDRLDYMWSRIRVVVIKTTNVRCGVLFHRAAGFLFRKWSRVWCWEHYGLRLQQAGSHNTNVMSHARLRLFCHSLHRES